MVILTTQKQFACEEFGIQEAWNCRSFLGEGQNVPNSAQAISLVLSLLNLSGIIPVIHGLIFIMYELINMMHQMHHTFQRCYDRSFQLQFVRAPPSWWICTRWQYFETVQGCIFGGSSLYFDLRMLAVMG